MRKGYADSSAGQIHYRYLPGSGIPLVYFHQTASSGSMWEKVMAKLSDIGPQYALDTPGFGGSFDPPEDSNPSMPEYTAWMREAIKSIGIDRCHILGHHTGACIGVEMAVADPALVQSLTLIGPVPLTADERLEFSKHFGTPFTPVVSGSYLLENWEYLRNLGAHADPMLMHREMTSQMRAYWGRVQSYKAVWAQDFTDLYQRVSCPLLVGAAPDDVLHAYLARALELRPDAKAMDIDGANFEPDLDADGVASGIRSFIGAL